MVDERAFLAALAAEPDDSGVRLVYSDWLEEGGRCPEALAQRLEAHRRHVLLRPDDDAPRLKYAEVLADAGHAGPAEFIRAQVALARFGEFEIKCGNELAGGFRQKAMLAWKDYAGFFGPQLASFGVVGGIPPAVCPQEMRLEFVNHRGPSWRAAPTAIVFRRGFVERVECLWRAWWGPPGRQGASDTYPRLHKAAALHPVTAVTFADPPDVIVRGPHERTERSADGNYPYHSAWSFVVGGEPLQGERSLSLSVTAREYRMRDSSLPTALALYRQRVAREASVDGFLRSCWPRVRDWRYPPRGNATTLPAEEWMEIPPQVEMPARDNINQIRFISGLVDMGPVLLTPRQAAGWMTRPNV